MSDAHRYEEHLAAFIAESRATVATAATTAVNPARLEEIYLCRMRPGEGESIMGAYCLAVRCGDRPPSTARHWTPR